MATEGRLTCFQGSWFFTDAAHVRLLDRVAELERRLGVKTYTVMQIEHIVGDGNYWLVIVQAVCVGGQETMVLMFPSEELARNCTGYTFEVEVDEVH